MLLEKVTGLFIDLSKTKDQERHKEITDKESEPKY